MKDRIRIARKRAKLSQSELASIVGVTQPTISSWESDGSEPSASDLIALSDALGVSASWLLYGDGGNGNGSALSRVPAQPELAGAAVATDNAR